MPSVATDLKTNLKSVPNFFFSSEQFLLLDTIGNKIAVAIFFEISLMATKKVFETKKCNKATTQRQQQQHRQHQQQLRFAVIMTSSNTSTGVAPVTIKAMMTTSTTAKTQQQPQQQ